VCVVGEGDLGEGIVSVILPDLVIIDSGIINKTLRRSLGDSKDSIRKRVQVGIRL
jgi:hypothetical protein